jgi:hypothetical protein
MNVRRALNDQSISNATDRDILEVQNFGAQSVVNRLQGGKVRHLLYSQSNCSVAIL